MSSSKSKKELEMEEGKVGRAHSQSLTVLEFEGLRHVYHLVDDEGGQCNKYNLEFKSADWLDNLDYFNEK